MLKILASDGIEASAAQSLKDLGHSVDMQFYPPEELGAKLHEYDVLVVRSATKVRQPIIDTAKQGGKLKLVIRGGVGVDNIDVSYAEQNGIAVRNTPKASSSSVAELALGHMFAMARFIAAANFTMRDGQWNKKHYEGIELAGKTLGLIGMGRISQELAKRAFAIGMNVIYTDIFEIKGLPEQYKSMTRDEVLQNADFVSLHIPMPEDKKPVICAAELAMMKPTTYIINTARGGLIDEDALCDALDNGKLAGATLDVFAEEPTKNERVLKNPLISLTPHIGGSTKEAQQRIGQEIVDIITDFFK